MVSAMSGRIRAVTFDVGGTLIECCPSVGHIYAEVAERHGYGGISPAVLNQKFKYTWKQFHGFNHSTPHWAALVDATFEGLVNPLPSRTFFRALYDRFSDADAWHVFEDVVPSLQILNARGIALGIISNWDDRLRPLLKALRLDSYFRNITISCEAGAHKPSPIIFAKACSRLNTKREETLHIGDSLEMDCEGARGAGLQALLLQRKPGRRRPGSIRSLRALNKI